MNTKALLDAFTTLMKELYIPTMSQFLSLPLVLLPQEGQDYEETADCYVWTFAGPVNEAGLREYGQIQLMKSMLGKPDPIILQGLDDELRSLTREWLRSRTGNSAVQGEVGPQGPIQGAPNITQTH